mmetsp:Transcript_30625/g.95790  ORF Transcript_30625/g.95790 Transcript_30625/m.95790 type:complete len:94 (-) Transcript_30625:148-429(-)
MRQRRAAAAAGGRGVVRGHRPASPAAGLAASSASPPRSTASPAQLPAQLPLRGGGVETQEAIAATMAAASAAAARGPRALVEYVAQLDAQGML